jgi:hypothetical protein
MSDVVMTGPQYMVKSGMFSPCEITKLVLCHCAHTSDNLITVKACARMLLTSEIKQLVIALVGQLQE